MLESSHRNKKGVNAMTKMCRAEEKGRQRGFVLDTREYALYKEKTLVKTIDKPAAIAITFIYVFDAIFLINV